MRRTLAPAYSPVSAVPKTEAKPPRFVVIDLLRGVAMLLMALDHSAGMAQTGITAEGYDGIRPALESWPHILTGLVTNLASGIFFTLAGTSVAFFERSRRQRAWTEWQISRFLLIRAVLLLVLDQFANKFAYYQPVTFDVLSAIAFALIILAFARHLPLRLLVFITAGLFLGYPLLVTLFPYDPVQPVSFVTTILFQHHTDSVPFVEFPALGRLSLALLGYILGRLMRDGKLMISARWLWVALAGFMIWLVLRLSHGYGDSLYYEIGMPLLYLFILNKQPPSLTFLLFYLSGTLVLLVVLKILDSRLRGTIIEWALTLLGQTSLFFYVVHLITYRQIISQMIPNTSFQGMGLIRGYFEFALGLIVLIPLCAAYRRLRRKYSILSYL